MPHPAAPSLPPARLIDLPGRGRLQVRHFGVAGGHPLILMHGWTATADLNWFTSYRALGQRFNVVAFDARGHGRGLRSLRPFRLSDCAADAVAVADALGIGRFTAVGYSMGGAVAQLSWRQHRDRVNGLVLCATARRFSRSTASERAVFGGLFGLSVAARLTPPAVRHQAVEAVLRRRGNRVEGDLADWAIDEVRRNDPAAVLQAGSAIGNFDSRPWIGEVDVPAAVVMSTMDNLVAPSAQSGLARAIPGATVHPVPGDHGMCVGQARLFVPALLEACTSVTERVLIPG